MFTFCLLWNLSFATTYLNRDKFTHNFLLCYHVATGRASQARLQNPRHLAVQWIAVVSFTVNFTACITMQWSLAFPYNPSLNWPIHCFIDDEDNAIDYGDDGNDGNDGDDGCCGRDVEYICQYINWDSILKLILPDCAPPWWWEKQRGWQQRPWRAPPQPRSWWWSCSSDLETFELLSGLVAQH